MDEGQLLDDRYRLSGRLGEGGVSETWQAHDELLDREVAVQVFAAGTAIRDRVLREAADAAGLSHPSVMGVYDYGETPEHGTYVVTELLRGPALADGPLPAGAAIRVCAEVAAGLAALHAAGLVHGDLTPGNVVLTADVAKVAGFGVLGSPGGDPGDPGEADEAGDVHALGGLLQNCVTGELPADGTAPDVERVRELCASCLADDPADRPAAAEVASVLAAAAGHPRPIRAIGIFAGPPADDVAEEFQTRRQLRLALVMSVAAAVLVASFLLTGDAHAPQGLAGGVPGVTGQPDWTSGPATDPGTDTAPSTATGGDPSTGGGTGQRVELLGNAGRPANATGGEQAVSAPAGTTAPPRTTAPAAPATTQAAVAVRLSTLGGVVVAGCADGKVTVLDVLPAPGAKVVSVQGGTRDTARVEIDLLAVRLRLNVRCVGGLPVATPI
ncbi:serine/threonine-protein kinase [Dactylosporangium cerinum]|uniref:Serine/threonine-protein kinase n=1 Tax=Dactylosporangium cerinum TaxID=1434730 RepID=A0ABV9VY58_9ACTN